jgi:pimeloyl-ACP methyl ester carboxylesterase
MSACFCTDIHMPMTLEDSRLLHFIRRAGIAAAVGVSAAASGCMLASPARSNVGAPPAELGAVNVVFPSASGSEIHAWYSRGRPGEGAVLLLHGVGENRSAMLARAQFLHRDGFTILAPDFQAHGESPGEHITFGALESLDAAAAMSFLRTTAPGERIGVIGVSMGGAATLLGPGPLRANAFVLESVYPTIRDAVSDRLGAWFGPLGGVARWFTSAVIDVVGSDAGVSEAQLQPIERIGRIDAPLLLLAGTADRYTPLVEAESLYAHAPVRKSFWAVVGAGHEDLHEYDPAGYERRVGNFLSLNLRAAAAATTRTATAASPAANRRD